jgi:DNA polymerase-3 subunit gamma/tau
MLFYSAARAVGKTTLARILAKAINCENPAADGEACNNCHSCISFNEVGTEYPRAGCSQQ